MRRITNISADGTDLWMNSHGVLNHGADNVLCSRLSKAANAAMNASAGDSIDRGLSLLAELAKQGFGVVYQGEPDQSLTGAQPAPAAPTHEARRWCKGDGEWTNWQPVPPGKLAERQADSSFEVRIAAPAAQPADSAMLDWLEEHCTGASGSERYLPFLVYWGKKGHGKSLREVIQAAIRSSGTSGSNPGRSDE